MATVAATGIQTAPATSSAAMGQDSAAKTKAVRIASEALSGNADTPDAKRMKGTTPPTDDTPRIQQAIERTLPVPSPLHPSQNSTPVAHGLPSAVLAAPPIDFTARGILNYLVGTNAGMPAGQTPVEGGTILADRQRAYPAGSILPAGDMRPLATTRGVELGSSRVTAPFSMGSMPQPFQIGTPGLGLTSLAHLQALRPSLQPTSLLPQQALGPFPFNYPLPPLPGYQFPIPVSALPSAPLTATGVSMTGAAPSNLTSSTSVPAYYSQASPAFSQIPTAEPVGMSAEYGIHSIPMLLKAGVQQGAVSIGDAPTGVVDLSLLSALRNQALHTQSKKLALSSVPVAVAPSSQSSSAPISLQIPRIFPLAPVNADLIQESAIDNVVCDSWRMNIPPQTQASVSCLEAFFKKWEQSYSPQDAAQLQDCFTLLQSSDFEQFPFLKQDYTSRMYLVITYLYLQIHNHEITFESHSIEQLKTARYYLQYSEVLSNFDLSSIPLHTVEMNHYGNSKEFLGRMVTLCGNIHLLTRRSIIQLLKAYCLLEINEAANSPGGQCSVHEAAHSLQKAKQEIDFLSSINSKKTKEIAAQLYANMAKVEQQLARKIHAGPCLFHIPRGSSVSGLQSRV